MKKKKSDKPIVIDPDSELYKRMKDRLYKKEAVFGSDSPFSELLQSMVDTLLKGEMSCFMEEEQASSRTNKRNGKTQKKVLTDLGPLEITTPRDWVSETALTKQIYLALMHNEKSWKKTAYGWKKIQRDLLLNYPERIKPWIEN